MTQTMTHKNSWLSHTNMASVLVVMLGMMLFNSVALTNIAVLGLVLLSPFAWREFVLTNQSVDLDAKVFLTLILSLCAWDVATNLMGGHSAGGGL